MVVDFTTVSINYHRFVFTKKFPHTFKSAGTITVIGVEPSDDFACCHPETFIQCCRLAAIRLRYPSEMGISLENLTGIVSRHRVDNDVFECRIILPEDTQDIFFKKFGLIKGWCYDGDSKRRHVATALAVHCTIQWSHVNPGREKFLISIQAKRAGLHRAISGAFHRDECDQIGSPRQNRISVSPSLLSKRSFDLYRCRY